MHYPYIFVKTHTVTILRQLRNKYQLKHTQAHTRVKKNPRFFLKKPNPLSFWGFIGLYWIFADFLFEWAVAAATHPTGKVRAVGKLVGWFSTSAKLLFRFISTVDYLKICKFITYWSLEAVNIKKLNYVWCGFFNGCYQNLVVFLVLPGCLNHAPHPSKKFHQSPLINLHKHAHTNCRKT